jgi:mannose-6-phosphate isomerase-like protein (cupin superfamily)
MDHVRSLRNLAWKNHASAACPGTGFGFTPTVVGSEYTDAYSAQFGRIGPGGSSRPHTDHYNHAFYFISGTGAVTIDTASWPLEPGSVVKIPAGSRHGFQNTGDEDLVFLVIYDPPYEAGGPFHEPDQRPSAAEPSDIDG